MAAKPPKAFDVWFVAANTVYKGVPYNVVADWVQQGRLATNDMLRPSGTTAAWAAVDKHELLADYLPRREAVKVAAPPAAAKAAGSAAAVASAASAPEATELPEPETTQAVSRFEEDDEVDMIPLIDISMVLLVFFIMIQAAGALASVDVPEMKYAGQLSADPEAITITIEKLNDEDAVYSVRLGNSPPIPGHDDLRTPGAAVEALTSLLVGTTRAPEVRIACHKDLPRKLIYDLRSEIEPLRKKQMVNNVIATVVEPPDDN